MSIHKSTHSLEGRDSVDDEGNEHEWSGRGRTPLAFQAYFDKGFTKDDCLI